MWQQGFVAEVRELAAAGLRSGRTASRALGYAQVLRFLDGEWSQEQAAAETVRATRRFARRQESWFRRDPRVVWLPAARGDQARGDQARGDQSSDDLSSADLAHRALDTIGSCGLPRATERETTS
jgi:tRNA A37 N6-isopentenylltransferase MiaA